MTYSKVRVAHFISKLEKPLERQINDFIKSTDNIKIIDIKYGTCDRTAEALVIYELD